MKKLVLTIVLMLTIICSSGGNTNALEVKEKNLNEEVMSELKLLSEKYEVLVSVTELDANYKGQLLEFKDVYEFENYLKAIKVNHDNIRNEISIVRNDDDLAHDLSSSVANARTYNDMHTISWYAPCTPLPVLGGYFIWKNVAFNYNYQFVNGHPQFINISNLSSYLTGINQFSWNQTNYTVNYTAKYHIKDTANFTIQGYYLLGVVIGNQPIGACINDTWTNISLTLK